LQLPKDSGRWRANCSSRVCGPIRRSSSGPDSHTPHDLPRFATRLGRPGFRIPAKTKKTTFLKLSSVGIRNLARQLRDSEFREVIDDTRKGSVLFEHLENFLMLVIGSRPLLKVPGQHENRIALITLYLSTDHQHGPYSNLRGEYWATSIQSITYSKICLGRHV